MNSTPISNRLHIGIFGKRNAGKSSFLNALTNQQLSIVSEIPGTTTDPVGKSKEITGLGPVYFYDTAGLDDEGDLGKKRIEKTNLIIDKVNIAIIVSTYSTFDDYERNLILKLKSKKIKFIIVLNKLDIEKQNQNVTNFLVNNKILHLEVSCLNNRNIDLSLKEIIKLGSTTFVEKDSIIGDIVKQGDIIFLVVPIDLGAPKGRLILPQVQVIRDIIDNEAAAFIVKERELQYYLSGKSILPNLVICDSQVVLKVVGDVPDTISLTTFSIIFSRLKGDLVEFVKSVVVIDELQNNDKVLILEACTHHAMPDDIGRVKIPRWLKQYTGKNIIFDVNAGPYVNKDLSDYKLVISCGGCMINRQEMMSRISHCSFHNVPVTNYGIAISYVHGVLKRALSPFPETLTFLK